MSKDDEDDYKHGSQYWNRSIESRLSEIISLMKSTNNQINTMAGELQLLSAQVTNTVQTHQLVVTLLTRVVEFITNNTTDPAALVNLTNILKDTTAALEAAAQNAQSALPPA